MKAEEMPVPPGAVIKCEVVSTEPWGVFVESLPPHPIFLASIDVLYMSEQRIEAWDFPKVGSVLTAVVLDPYPGSIVRLSIRERELRGES